MIRECVWFDCRKRTEFSISTSLIHNYTYLYLLHIILNYLECTNASFYRCVSFSQLALTVTIKNRYYVLNVLLRYKPYHITENRRHSSILKYIFSYIPRFEKYWSIKRWNLDFHFASYWSYPRAWLSSCLFYVTTFLWVKITVLINVP